MRLSASLRQSASRRFDVKLSVERARAAFASASLAAKYFLTPLTERAKGRRVEEREGGGRLLISACATRGVCQHMWANARVIRRAQTELQVRQLLESIRLDDRERRRAIGACLPRDELAVVPGEG